MSGEINPALEGSPLSGYLKFAIPSIVGLLAWAAAPIIDGLFIANFMGMKALAAVNLIIPVFTVAFGISYMISIGGSVRAGKYIGEGNRQAAIDIFSKTVIANVIYSLIFVTAGTYGSEALFALLGAGPGLYPYMHDYFNTLLWFLPVQALSITCYYFVRIAGHPTLVSVAIVIGAVANPALNYLFIVVLELGMRGAALATGLSVTLMLGVTLLYRFSPKSWLEFKPLQSNWKEIMHAAYNGVSDFIDEISAGIVTLVLNLIVIESFGEKGVAAFGVVSYSLFIGILFFFGLSEALQAVCSQCYGARNTDRMKQFLRLTMVMTVISAIAFSGLLLVLGDVFIGFFINESEIRLIAMSREFISILWPIFLFTGLNILIVAYLTSVHRPTASAAIAVLRALLFPLGLLYVITQFFPQIPFLVAVTAGEMLAFLVAVWFFLKHRPGRLFAR